MREDDRDFFVEHMQHHLCYVHLAVPLTQSACVAAVEYYILVYSIPFEIYCHMVTSLTRGLESLNLYS